MTQERWKVTCNNVCGERLYAVYRLRDINSTDHSGNREYATDYMESKEEALKIASQMNESEEKEKC